jgi:hypothetical protein
MKKLVMLFLATMVLAGASFAQATTSTDNGMKSDAKTEAAPKKAKKAKKEKAPKAPKAAKTKKAKKDKAAATTDAPMAAPAK